MIYNSTIANTNTTILSVPSGQSYANVTLAIANVSSTASETITVYAVPNGGSVGDSTRLLKKVINPNDTYVFDSKLLLGSLDSVVGIGATGGLLTVTVSYLAI